MYIEPATNIRLLHNVPLDTSYDHTIYFSSASAQSSYFIGLTKYSLASQTYQRVQRGRARVQYKADDLYDCNYMMFQNANYGTKWFYAFITGVEFVNNITSEITFEIDVMQTWFFDCSPDYCFVEREHVDNDAIGSHIEPEPVSLGEYVMNGYTALGTALQPLAVYVMIVDEDEDPNGTLYDGIYGGATLFAYNSDDIEGIKAKLSEYLQKPDAIVGMYMAPVIATGSVIPDGGKQIEYSDAAYTLSYSGDAITSGTALNGYVPKNNKLYTYPYSFFHIDNASGAELNLRYEFFTDLTPKCDISVPMTMPIQCTLRPKGYKGSNDNTYNAESISLTNYPMCSWSTDAFKAWLAQNAIPIGAELIKSAAGGAIFGGIGGTVGGLVGGVANALSQGYQASIQADIARGSINNGNGNVAAGKQLFYGGRASITQDYAMMIDDFFTMYGYAVRRCKVPNRSARPHWNYVKTIGCCITGSVPADDMRKICGIYDAGITFWKNGSEVGNYSLNNSL